MYTLTNDTKRIYVSTGESVTLARLTQVFIESGSTSNRAAIEAELQSLFNSLESRA